MPQEKPAERDKNDGSDQKVESNILDSGEFASFGDHGTQQPNNAGNRGHNTGHGCNGDRPEGHAKHQMSNGMRRIGARGFYPTIGQCNRSGYLISIASVP